MKKFTDQEIAQIRAELNNGTQYCGIENGRGIGLIYADEDYIYWRHAGGSANKNTDEELRWLLENIFDDCETVTPAEWSDYHINYVPIDNQYQGIDLSRSHPNVYGC